MEYVFIMGAIVAGIFMPPKEMQSEEHCVLTAIQVQHLYQQRNIEAEAVCFRFTDTQGWYLDSERKWVELVPEGA